jgi:3-oxoacyl-[acyl-carrier protein] reductase
MSATAARRVAVVTGGSRGIGRSAAERLAADGFDLLLVSHSAENLEIAAEALAETGRRVEVCDTDLRLAAGAERVREAVESSFGRVDVLLNCAGATKGGAFLEVPDAVWEDGFALKFFGTMRLCRALWPMLREARGAVVNIVGGFARTPDPDFLIGGAVNAALANFSKGLSKQGMRDDVTVNMIHPGTTVTGRLHKIAHTRAELEGSTEEEVFASLASREKIRRLGRPEDVARVVSFLCDRDSRHIQGVAISVDGGATQSLF